MITKIAIENFKGIKDRIEIDLKPITLLFGPNSAGKSTIVQALHYAREIFCRRNYDPKETEYGGSMDLGGFQNLVHEHDNSLPIKMRFDLEMTEEDNLPNYDNEYEEYIYHDQDIDYSELSLPDIEEEIKTAWVEITIEWHKELLKPLVTRYEVGVNSKLLAFFRIEGFSADGNTNYRLYTHIPDDEIKNWGEGGELGLLNIIPEKYREYFFMYEMTESAIPRFGKYLDLDIVENEVLLDDDIERIKRYVTKLVVGPGELIANELENMRYIGPIREIPARNFQPVKFSDESRWANGLAAWDLLYESSESFIDDVNKWLSMKLDTGHTVNIIEYRELYYNLFHSLLSEDILDNPEDLKKQLFSMETKKRLSLTNNQGVEVMPSDIGVGISQLIPIIVGVLSKEDQSILSIEQPELHLHPAIQVNLADLFISQKDSSYTNCNYIIETHSEHFMLRLLRRIEETTNNELPYPEYKLQPKDVSIVYVESFEEAVKMTPLPINETGEFTRNWPHGFFEEREEDLF